MQHTRIMLIIKKLQSTVRTLINYNKLSKYHCAHFVAGLNTEVRSIHLPFRGFGEYSTPASHHLLNLCKNSARFSLSSRPSFSEGDNGWFPLRAERCSARELSLWRAGSSWYMHRAVYPCCSIRDMPLRVSEEVVVDRVKGALESLQVVIVLNIRFNLSQ